ncbi:uncharacterized protein TNCV_3236101 [Trichonephila clavipes]|nr:uncharacterized protein TNCV_3236101 [Trichonephila clavipes]
MTFVQGVKSFFTCPCSLLASPAHLLDCWGIFLRQLYEEQDLVCDTITRKGLEKPKERGKKDRKRRGLVVFGKRKRRVLGVLDRDADDESWTRMRKNTLRTVPRQAGERTTRKRGYHTG